MTRLGEPTNLRLLDVLDPVDLPSFENIRLTQVHRYRKNLNYPYFKHNHSIEIERFHTGYFIMLLNE